MSDRSYRTYRGVKIQRIKTMVCGSDFRIAENGRMVSTKPQYEVSFKYAGGYPSDTLDEVKADIDSIYAAMKLAKIDEDDFIRIMNTDQTL